LIYVRSENKASGIDFMDFILTRILLPFSISVNNLFNNLFTAIFAATFLKTV